MIRVCIIDDGVTNSKENLNLEYDMEITKECNIESRKNMTVLNRSHASVCAQIMKKYCPSIILSSIKLSSDQQKVSNSQHLLAALKYCINSNFDIIHMSIGTVIYSDFEDIRKCINKLVSNGKVVVAACSNRGIFTVPACLPNVIGVCSRRDLKGDEYEYNSLNCDGIDFIASSRHQIDGEITPYSNSCAAPYITAKVGCDLIINPFDKLKTIRENLIKTALNYTRNQEIIRREDLIYISPDRLDNYYNTLQKNRNIENPIICLFEFSTNKLLELKKKFIEIGYNCLLVTDRLQDDFFDSEYINFLNTSIIKKAVLSLNSFYSPDLLILGIVDTQIFNIREFVGVDLVYKNNVLEMENEITECFYSNDVQSIFKKLLNLLGGNNV